MPEFFECLQEASIPKRYNLLRSDPTTGILLVALWSLTNSLGFLSTPDFQHRPVLFYLEKLGFPGFAWAIAMFVDAVALALSLLRLPNWVRSLIAVMTSVFWMLYGTFILLGGERIGVLAPSGLFSIMCALCCSAACLQWVFQEHQNV